MGLQRGVFISTFSILLISNMILYFLYPLNTNLLSLTGVGTTVLVYLLIIVLVILSIQIFGTGLSNAKPIVAFIILIGLLYKYTSPAYLLSAFTDLDSVEIGIGLVTNLTNFMGTDINNVGWIIVNGLGFITLFSGLMLFVGGDD